MIVPVKTDTWNYDIVLEPGAIKKAGELLNLNRRVLVVTDSGVPAQYAETVAAQCGEAAIVTLSTAYLLSSIHSLPSRHIFIINISKYLPLLIIFYIKLHLMSYNLVFIIALIIWTFFILRCKKPCIIILVHIYITHELLRFFIIYHIIAIITIIMSYRHCYLFPVCSILHSYFQACNHPNQGIHT